MYGQTKARLSKELAEHMIHHKPFSEKKNSFCTFFSVQTEAFANDSHGGLGFYHIQTSINTGYRTFFLL